MDDTSQSTFSNDVPEVAVVMEAVREILGSHAQPSAWELLEDLERRLGLKVRWVAENALRRLVGDPSLTHSQRDYLRDLLESDDWRKAVRGAEAPGRAIKPALDELFKRSKAYRNSKAFREMITFVANFRRYAPYNNFLVRLQNPLCSFYATEKDWFERFHRGVKDDASPMLILAPNTPVLLVYDLDSTEGPEPLPEELRKFAKFEGMWNPRGLELTIENASTRDLIRIDSVRLASTTAGYAAIYRGRGGKKMRIALRAELDEPSRYGVLLHELGHVHLGHLGGDKDGWWPSRGDLDQHAMEVEAEAVAYIAGQRVGLEGASAQYVSRYLGDDAPVPPVSLDHIARVARLLEEMGTKQLGPRAPRKGAQDDSWSQPKVDKEEDEGADDLMIT